ncbi:MAG: PilZ domain-containing protein [Nitrospiraceae bacterium]
MERRKLPRYEVQLPVAFAGNEGAGVGLVINLSNEGCTVASEELVLPHAFLALRLQLPEQDEPLKVEVAEVRWGTGLAFGLEFVQLRAEEQERLQRFITVLEASQNN